MNCLLLASCNVPTGYSDIYMQATTTRHVCVRHLPVSMMFANAVLYLRVSWMSTCFQMDLHICMHACRSIYTRTPYAVYIYVLMCLRNCELRRSFRFYRLVMAKMSISAFSPFVRNICSAFLFRFNLRLKCVETSRRRFCRSVVLAASFLVIEKVCRNLKGYIKHTFESALKVFRERWLLSSELVSLKISMSSTS